MLLSGWFALASYGAWVLNVEKAQQGFGVWLGHWGSNVGMFAAYSWSTVESLTRAEWRGCVGCAPEP